MKISFLDFSTIHPGDLNLSALESISNQCVFYDFTAPEMVSERLRQSDIIISNKVSIGETVLRESPHLSLICIAATGTNNVDLRAAAALGIPVCNVRNYATPSVVQHVFALILALRQHVAEYHQLVGDGMWASSRHFCLFDHPFQELAGKKLGVVGYGALGQAVAKVATAFDMDILIAQRADAPAQPGRLPLDDLFRQADIVSLHCPLTPTTEKLINARTLELMPHHALLINTARGGLIDERALADALRQGRIAGAGLDVLAEEPPAHGGPLLAPDIPNLIITPHIAWASREARQRLVNEVAENIRAFLAGKPRNLVTG